MWVVEVILVRSHGNSGGAKKQVRAPSVCVSKDKWVCSVFKKTQHSNQRGMQGLARKVIITY